MYVIIYIYISPLPLPNAMPPQAPRTAPAPRRRRWPSRCGRSPPGPADSPRPTAAAVALTVRAAFPPPGPADDTCFLQITKLLIRLRTNANIHIRKTIMLLVL